MSQPSAIVPGLHVPIPARPEQLDVPLELVADLVLRRVLLEETSSLRRLSQSLGVSVLVIERVFEELRGKQYLDVHAMSGNDYSFSLTAAGRQIAVDRYSRCRYAGVVPVSLALYKQVVAAQRPRTKITRDTMRLAFADLVVNDDLMDSLGPAMISQTSIFLYGPSGNGKTSLGERLVRVYDDSVLIPWAVEVDGSIISVYDTSIHIALTPQPPGLDPRWVACRRPMVIVGGELEFKMLQLRYDAISGVYAAPLQMKANNGILMVDDFGRQAISPADLLNRWIIPLDRRIDFLSLNHGVQFSTPFDLLVVFSTNLDPQELGDDAFFRRIQNKVFVGPIADDEFDWIVARMVELEGVRAETGVAAHLNKLCRELGNGELRACYPRDMVRLLRSVCDYEGTPVVLSRENLERAAKLYFDVNVEAASACKAGARFDPLAKGIAPRVGVLDGAQQFNAPRFVGASAPASLNRHDPLADTRPGLKDPMQ